MAPPSKPRKLGRPPATSSVETRDRILRSARECFATRGFEATTNRQLAEAAGLTTGAIYHYFGSKTDLYVEAHDQVQQFVYARFADAIEDVERTFAATITAVLDEAQRLNLEDPSLANFLAAVRTDVGRHRELAQDRRLAPVRRSQFFGALIDLGIETGEIRAEDRAVVAEVISAVMMGLVSASSQDHEVHARAVSGVKALLAGTLVRRVASLPTP